MAPTLADAEVKDLAQRAHAYLERSFMPGRQFTDPADFNTQLGAWIAVANTRRELGCAARESQGGEGRIRTAYQNSTAARGRVSGFGRR